MSRGWCLADLQGQDRKIAESVVNAVFSTVPGTEAEAKAWARFEEFDKMLCERDGWTRHTR